MNKQEIHSVLQSLSSYLLHNLATKREEIVKRLQEATPKGGEPEGRFIKLFLAPLLREFFEEKSEGLIIEGIESKRQASFKNAFFGSKPAPDFRFKPPLPFNLVGEVKYGKLQLHSFATAIGQLLLYLEASKNEIEQSEYGLLIFFGNGKTGEVTREEKDFIELMWERENCFIVIT